MTEIRYNKRKSIVRWSLYGHAGYNPGNDIVCAGLSTITFQLLNTLKRLQDDGKIRKFVADLGDGSAIMNFEVIDEETWETVRKVILIGYECIAEQYPEHVKLVGVNDIE